MIQHAKGKDSGMADALKVSIEGAALDALRKIARLRNVTPLEAVRIAIGSERFLAEEAERGTRILLKKPSGEMREVVAEGRGIEPRRE